MFFWVFPRRQIVVGRSFGTLCQFHLQRLGVEYSTPSLWKWNWHRVPKRRPTTIWRRGNTQKNIYNIQITAKVWKQEQNYYLSNVECQVWPRTSKCQASNTASLTSDAVCTAVNEWGERYGTKISASRPSKQLTQRNGMMSHGRQIMSQHRSCVTSNLY